MHLPTQTFCASVALQMIAWIINTYYEYILQIKMNFKANEQNKSKFNWTNLPHTPHTQHTQHFKEPKQTLSVMALEYPGMFFSPT